MPGYYPIMLNIRERPALVIGGDDVAAEKAAALSASGARVTVLSVEFCPALLALAEQGTITLRKKAYAQGDLAGAFVVVAATTYDPQLSEAIWNEAQERGQLVNIVDVPKRCNFIVPSILRRGQLTIAVSTEGASPSLSKRIRQRLEGLFPAAYDSYMQLAVVARTHLRQHGVSYEQRDAFFGEYYHSEILNLLAEDNAPQALALTTDLLRRYGVEISTETVLEDLAHYQ
jgi:precorrin-2 dehydrogenase / sirohydrochlorin ferrochelatase